MFLIASAGLLAREADFRERHGTEFTNWLYDRLVTAVVSTITVPFYCKKMLYQSTTNIYYVWGMSMPLSGLTLKGHLFQAGDIQGLKCTKIVGYYNLSFRY